MITPDIHSSGSKKISKTAVFLALILIIACLLSIIAIICRLPSSKEQLTAYIYQNGELIQSIDLNNVPSDYTFTITSPNGNYNEISVKQGGIAIIDADCPHKLCVSLGYADSSLLPIVCLPHNLVILVKETTPDTPDMMTY